MMMIMAVVIIIIVVVLVVMPLDIAFCEYLGFHPTPCGGEKPADGGNKIAAGNRTAPVVIVLKQIGHGFETASMKQRGGGVSMKTVGFAKK